MANPSKAKGTAGEVAVRDCLRAHGYDAERLPTEGAKDRGDIIGVPGVAIEVKACRDMALGQWVGEANVEAFNRGPDYIGVVWHKRRGTTDPRRWYVTMDGDAFLELLSRAGGPHG